jgi:hypothetical protein
VLTKANIISARLARHHLHAPLPDENGYLDLFRMLQPVSTLYYTCPGAPPCLGLRTVFDDRELTARWRPGRKVVKGRFLGDGIGYVLADELELYANAFRKAVSGLNENQQRVMDALRACGPLAPRQIKEETGLLNKEIMPALHRLQKAFMVFEDQSDSDWERPWCLFEEEWPAVELADCRREPAAVEVVTRFLRANVFATFAQIKDWSRLPVRLLKTITAQMLEQGSIIEMAVDGLGTGFVRREDQSLPRVDTPDSVLMLHKADPLVKAHATELKARFGHEETLQYLLVDGELKGAVIGHWRIGPHDVEDVVLLLDDDECRRRREAVLSAIARVYSPPRSQIRNYCGESIGLVSEIV